MVCLRCRARAIAEDRDPYAVAGAACTRCGERWAVSAERPLCGPCYDVEVRNAPRPEVRWFVQGSLGRIDIWSVEDRTSTPLGTPQQNAVDSVRSRLALYLPTDRWLRLSVVAGSHRVNLLELACGLTSSAFDDRSGIFVERLPERKPPACLSAPDLRTDKAVFVSLGAVPDVPKATRWKPQCVLAAWKQALQIGRAHV